MTTESDPCTVFVGNLPWDVTWQTLKDHMQEQVGGVERADVMTQSDGRSKGSGLVKFASAEDAQRAIDELTDTELGGRPIFVRADRGAAGGGRGAGRGRSRDKPYSRDGGGKGGKGGRGKGGRAKSEPKSAGDLDADLESYMAGR